MPRTNEEVEELLAEWAELLQISGGDPYRVRAYEKAARAVGGYSKDLRDLDDKGILAIPNVGKSMACRRCKSCKPRSPSTSSAVSKASGPRPKRTSRARCRTSRVTASASW